MNADRDDPVETDGDLRRLFADSVTLLHSARAAVAERLAGLEKHEPKPFEALIKAQRELAVSLKLALETELKFNEWIERHARDEGAANADIDLDAARHEIGCRLDRLRACCYSE